MSRLSFIGGIKLKRVAGFVYGTLNRDDRWEAAKRGLRRLVSRIREAVLPVRNAPLATSGLLAWSLRGPRFQGRQSACALVRNWYKFSVEYSTIALFLSGDGPSCGSSGAGYTLDGLDVAPGAAQTLGPQR